MSRFFETLNEVSRSQPAPAPAPASVPAQEAGRKNGAENLESVIEAAQMMSAPVQPPAAEPDLPHLNFAPEDFLGTAPAPRTEIGKTVDVRLDPGAALLPHTGDSTIVEQYRRLRTKIQQQQATKPIASLLVTSPGPSEGKTVTILNLAMSFGMLPSFRVLVVDGDLRKGTIRRWLGIGKLPGFSNLIEGSARLEDVVLKSDVVPFHFMLGGTSDKPAADLLNSPRLKESVRRMTQHFDLVLVDSPPVNLIADAQMLAGSCDGVLLVARAFNTTTTAFEKMLHDMLPFRVIGTVLNGGTRSEPYRKYKY